MFFFYKRRKGAFAQLRKRKNVFFRSVRVIRLIRPIVLPPGFYVFLFFTGGIAGAQTGEARIDGYVAGPAAIHAGAGFTVPMGTYVRSGIDGAIGSSKDGISGRMDAFARFHLDPFRQHRWAPYGGGGLTARFDDNRSTRYYLLVFLGVDGPAVNRISTSIEAGLGGGGRIGVIVRRAGERR
jgi:hypothetical protein